MKIPSTLEVAASTGVLRERRRQALDAATNGVVIGRHFLTLRGVAEACAAETGAPLRAELGSEALARVVRHAARDVKSFGPLIEERPGLAHALAATVRDLRDAGVPDGALGELPALAELYRGVERRLAALREEGLYDRIGLFALARDGAVAWLERLAIEQIEVHGATELVGSAGDLIEALHRARSVSFFQPDCRHSYAAALRAAWPWSYRPVPQPYACTPPVRVAPLARPRDELEFAAREILRLLEGGADPAGIFVVARSLERYAPWVHRTFERYGIPFSSFLDESLLEDAGVRARLFLGRTLLLDLERQPTLDLLAAPTFKRSAGRLGELAEVLARRGRVQGRIDDWIHAIENSAAVLVDERHHASDPEIAELERTLRELEDERALLAQVRSWSDFASRFDEICARRLERSDSPGNLEAAELARGSLRSLAALDRIDAHEDQPQPPEREELLAGLEAVWSSTLLRPDSRDTGGVRLLGVLQARALPIEHLFLIGMNHGSWPLELRDDPFLPSSLRERLRSQSGRPLSSPRHQEEESDFLLRLLVAQTSGSVTLTWHERDASERECAPSILLHEFEPAVLQRKVARPVAARSLGTRADALVDAAFALGPTHAIARLAELSGRLWPEQAGRMSAGFALVRATESWEPSSLAYDGFVDQVVRPWKDAFSPILVEQLGQCPQRAFFGRILEVRELQQPPTHQMDPRERGTVLHEMLGSIYQKLAAEGALRSGSAPDAALTRARALLSEAIDSATGQFRERLRARHPAIWDALRRQLTQASEAFLARDLEELLPAGVHSFSTEQSVTFERGALKVAGRPDRVVELTPGQFRVGDYKTSKNVARYVARADIRKGKQLQIPLYAMAIAQRSKTLDVEAEVLAVPLRPERVSDERKLEVPRRTLDELQDWARGPLDALSGLLAAGAFPFRVDPDICRTCAYVVACRREHVPSEERIRGASPFSAYFALHSHEREP